MGSGLRWVEKSMPVPTSFPSVKVPGLGSKGCPKGREVAQVAERVGTETPWPRVLTIVRSSGKHFGWSHYY